MPNKALALLAACALLSFAAVAQAQRSEVPEEEPTTDLLNRLSEAGFAQYLGFERTGSGYLVDAIDTNGQVVRLQVDMTTGQITVFPQGGPATGAMMQPTMTQGGMGMQSGMGMQGDMSMQGGMGMQGDMTMQGGGMGMQGGASMQGGMGSSTSPYDVQQQTRGY